MAPGALRLFWLARHANRLDLADPGWAAGADRPLDPPLAPDGFGQALALGRRMAASGIRRIYSSPFLRAVQTADAVAAAAGLPVLIEPGLGEHLSPGAGLPLKLLPSGDLARMFPRIDPSHKALAVPAYPETEEQMLARTRAAVEALAAANREPFMAVSHGDPIRGMVWALVPGRPEVRWERMCSLFRLSRDKGDWRLDRNGDTGHLGGDEG